jgi:hypothetical protein
MTLAGTLGSLLLGINTKPLHVLFFVIVAGLISFTIGVGILRFKRSAYRALLYFASVVFLSKILILMGIIHLDGAMETVVPSFLKNSASLVYHGYVIYYLQKRRIRKIFHIWP